MRVETRLKGIAAFSAIPSQQDRTEAVPAQPGFCSRSCSLVRAPAWRDLQHFPVRRSQGKATQVKLTVRIVGITYRDPVKEQARGVDVRIGLGLECRQAEPRSTHAPPEESRCRK